MTFPSSVGIVEVGPRDGLQNEPLSQISLEIKIEFVNLLGETGVTHIETGSFVSPEWVPSMADSAELLKKIARNPGVSYSALAPNLKGLERAVEAGVDEIVVFSSASETFSEKNVNCTIDESLERIRAVMLEAGKLNIPIRGYVATVLGCPYEGDVSTARVADVAKALYEMGCYEIALADTYGTGTPLAAKKLIETVARDIPIEKLAVHFHDTNGLGLTNLYAVLEEGVAVVDCSAGGIGGCPYAPGAAGNLATEDVVFMLDSMGIATGVDLDKIIACGNFIRDRLGRPARSKFLRTRK